jgi:zinc transporter ZupT
MHLLPEAEEGLSSVYADYSLSYALAALGVVLVLFIDKMTILWVRRRRLAQRLLSISSSEKPGQSCNDHDSSRISDEHHENCGFVTCVHSLEEGGGPRPRSISPRVIIDAESASSQRLAGVPGADLGKTEEEDEVHGLVAELFQTDDLRDLMTTYLMEMTVAIHSVIIGVNLGLMGESDVATIVSLMIALGFHQAIEGFSLGAQIASSHTEAGALGAKDGERVVFGRWKVAVFVLIFCLTTPLGIVIGVLSASEEETPSQLAAKGVAEAIAAGSLLYLALCEMIPQVFSAPSAPRAVRLGGGKGAAGVVSAGMGYHEERRAAMLIGSFALGIAFTAVLAVWA